MDHNCMDCYFLEIVKLDKEKSLETTYNFINSKAERHVQKARVDQF